MSHEDIARIELENTVKRLLEGASRTKRQVVISDDSPEANVQSPGNLEKTAHDFRASLNIVIGFTELMLDEVTGKINKEQRRSLNDIFNNGKRLQRLSEEIIKRLENVRGIGK